MEEQEKKKVNQIDPRVIELLTEEEKESLAEFSEMGIDVNQFASDYAKEKSNDVEEPEDDETFDDVEELEEEEDTTTTEPSDASTPATTTEPTDNTETESAPKQDFSDMFNNF